MHNLQSNNIYWLAGLLEGEGYFGLVQGKYPRIKLEMTDLDIVQKARDIMNSSAKIETIKWHNEKSGHKIQYRIQINSQLAVGWMMTLYVLMGSRRREKIREILQIWKANQLTWGENIVQTKNVNRAVEVIMMVRGISQEEAKKVLQESLTPKNQTIN